MPIKMIDKMTGLTVPKVSPLFCDKLVVTLPVSENYHSDIINIFKNHICGNYGTKKYWHSTSLYKHAVKIPFDPICMNHLLFQCSPWNAKHSFVRVEYNPSKTVPMEVRVILDQILPHGFDSLYYQGKLRRIDLAVDMSHVSPHNLIFHLPGISCSRNFLKAGRIQSAYLGEKESLKQMVVYDKVAELKKQNAKTPQDLKYPMPPCDITRVEVRLRPDGISFPGLLKIENPYNKLQLCVCKDVAKGDDEYLLFRRLCIYEGLPQVLKLLSSKDKRQKYVNRIMSEGFTSFWKPDNVWDGLQDALENAGIPVGKAPGAATNNVSNLWQQIASEANCKVFAPSCST
jgi:hypothetical protein